MSLYDLARKAKGKYKEYKKQQAGRYLSPVRRLERVAPISSGRYAAMTFDDGPSAMETNPKRSDRVLSDDLMDTLAKYGAKGTFDVIGTTEYNYPDVAGPIGTFTWGGVAYDHYPDFEKDALAGVKNQPGLTRRMLDEGHELTSHTYRHVLFGQNRIVYGKRKYYQNIRQVIEDLQTLDDLVRDEYGFRIRMSRPPHYIDKTCDGHSAYDAYRYMDYLYMAASFDGGGWQVSGDYQKDVQAMITPLERALASNPDSLNGQINFQKDGCNMSKQTPIADALDQQLKLLYDNGYQIITVSQLIEMSPFEDTGDKDPVHESARRLINAGYCVAYQNNTLQPDRQVTFGELVTMSVAPDKHLKAFRDYVDAGFTAPAEIVARAKAYGVGTSHPYFHAFRAAMEQGLLDAANPQGMNVSSPVTPAQFTAFCTRLNGGKKVNYTMLNTSDRLKRRDVFPLLAELLQKE